MNGIANVRDSSEQSKDVYKRQPQDVWEALLTDQENYFFVDVQARGYYPSYAVKRLEKKEMCIRDRVRECKSAEVPITAKPLLRCAKT